MNVDSQWMENCDKSLARLKYELIHTLDLAYPDLNEPFNMFTDASNKFMSGILLQHKKPIGYFSRSIKKSQLSWSTIVKEARVVCNSIEQFSDIIVGCKVRLGCDHKLLQNFLTHKTKSQLVNKWSIDTQQFNGFLVPTDDNPADCLSRLIDDSLWEPTPPIKDEDDFPSIGPHKICQETQLVEGSTSIRFVNGSRKMLTLNAFGELL